MDQTKMNAWKVGVGCASVLCFLLLLLALNQIKYLFEPGPAVPAATNTITVNGTGSVFVKPDLATFDFGVTETAATVGAAQDAATAKINAAVDAMASAGVASSDVQAISYNINPHYEYSNQPCVYNTPISSGDVSGSVMIPVCPSQKSTLTGYDVSETIQVKVHDITKAGSLFQTIGSLGVQNINDLQFSLNDPENAQSQARTSAITDAQSKASALASELGVHIVRIVGFSDNNGGGIVPLMYSANAMVSGGASAPAPAVPQGQQQITDNVSVTYEIP